MNITGTTADIITWTTPDVTDNTIIFQLSGSRPFDTTFSLGVTHVTYTATDNYNNVATCTFTVTIEGKL